MKILRPDISSELQSVTNLAQLLLKDETLSGLMIQNGNASTLRIKSATVNDSKLLKCDLSKTKIEKLQLQDCHIEQCDLTAASFADSGWHAVEVVHARCSGIQLQASLMKNVLFKGCKLDFANLRFARLENVIFNDCVISELDLYSAQLKNVAFITCDIEAMEFSEAKLQQVDLSGASIISLKGLRGLKGAVIAPEQMIQLAPYMAQEIGLIIKD